MKAPDGSAPAQTTARVLLSSLIGTTVEFYDFYIYATAASLVFGPLFFPASVPSFELIGAYASFGLAFMARPLGGAVFGHFGDRIGRKVTLVASLLLMGTSTAAVGLLPTYAVAGWLAPALLCVMRFGQGFALGGEWTGAALLALENAPAGWRARFAMFAPLGAPLGFILANGLFLLLTLALSPDQFHQWGWRVPFLASAPLVWMGLWVRFNLLETEEFEAALREAQPPRVPLVELVRTQAGNVVAGTFGVVACFSLYYTATAFVLGYGTSTLGHTRTAMLLVELCAILFMAAGIVAASWLSDRLDPSRVLIAGCVGTIMSGVFLAPLVGGGSLLAIFLFLAFALLVMGFVNGPLGAWLPSLFPPRVRYTGTSVAFNIGGILGGAFSPLISQWLAERSGLVAVGFYLAITGGLSLIAFDVSARRRAAGALAQSERRYRSIFEQTHVALCEIDLSGMLDLALGHDPLPSDSFEECARAIRLVDVNDAAVRLLGCRSRTETLGSFDRFGAGRIEIVCALIETIKQNGGRCEMQARLRTLDGREITAILVVGLPEDHDTLDRAPLAMIDVTEREQAKEALLAAQSELARAGRVSSIGAVSASIAHEVNQPIGAVVISAQACLRWLRREPPDLSEASLAAEGAVREGLRASEIIKRTREQLRNGRRRVEVIQLGTVVNEALTLMERDLEAMSIKPIFNDLAGESAVLADRVEMQQVVVNLISNAAHAMADVTESQRSVRIGLAHGDAGVVRLWVWDNGSGIRGDHLTKLFDPFFTTKQEGMGIGLAICKTIIEAHGGNLKGGNHDQGGAIFELTLPIHDASMSMEAAARRIVA